MLLFCTDWTQLVRLWLHLVVASSHYTSFKNDHNLTHLSWTKTARETHEGRTNDWARSTTIFASRPKSVWLVSALLIHSPITVTLGDDNNESRYRLAFWATTHARLTTQHINTSFDHNRRHVSFPLVQCGCTRRGTVDTQICCVLQPPQLALASLASMQAAVIAVCIGAPCHVGAATLSSASASTLEPPLMSVSYHVE